MKEAWWLVREANKRYNAQKEEVVRNKESWFKRRNVHEWGCPPDKIVEAMNTMDDAERAFQFMLPNVSNIHRIIFLVHSTSKLLG